MVYTLISFQKELVRDAMPLKESGENGFQCWYDTVP